MNVSSLIASRQDGVSAIVEELQLAYGADLIAEAGICLRLSQVTIATAQVLFHRFYVVASLHAHGHIWTAAAALLVACKTEEQHRRIRDIANGVHYCFCAREGVGRKCAKGRPVPLDYYGEAGFEWKRTIIASERHLLKELGFQVFVNHLHKFVLVFANILREKAGLSDWDVDGGRWRRMLQGAWNYANDAHRSRLPIFESAEAVACACISLSADRAGVTLPPQWTDVFGTGRAQCDRIRGALERVYAVGSTAGSFEDLARCGIVAMVVLG
jgi:cyclin L